MSHQCFCHIGNNLKTHGCRSVDAYRGLLVRGTLDVGPPTFEDVVKGPLMRRILA